MGTNYMLLRHSFVLYYSAEGYCDASHISEQIWQCQCARSSPAGTVKRKDVPQHPYLHLPFTTPGHYRYKPTPSPTLLAGSDDTWRKNSATEVSLTLVMLP